jgi:hypothetical protein
MTKSFYTLFFFLLTLTMQAQHNKRANVWYITQGLGYNFNCTPPCPLENGALGEAFCSASICDTNGSLLLYTDNETIWNRNHQVIANGTGLYSCKWASQGCVFVPLASNPNLYYLITVDSWRDKAGSPNPYACKESSVPVQYSMCLHLIDVAANNGAGQVLWKNKVIYGDARINDILGTVKHANTRDTWLMTYDYNIRRFVSLLLTECGVRDTIISSVISSSIDNANRISNNASSPLIFSPQGDAFSVCVTGLDTINGYVESYFIIGRFNDTTGIMENFITLDKSSAVVGTFSTDSRYLYTSDSQYDISIWDSTAITQSRKVINPLYNFLVQNAPDGKMYGQGGPSTGLQMLSWTIVNDPLLSPATISFQPVLVTKPIVPLKNRYIPNFVQSWFDPDFNEYKYGSPKINYTRVCKGEKTIFKSTGMPPATPYHWEIIQPNQPIIRFDNQDSIAYIFSQSGEFTVKLSIDFACMPDVITRTDIVVDSLPKDYLQDVYLCSGSNVTLQAQPDQISYLWNTGNTTAQQIIEVDNTYYVDVTNSCGSIRDAVNVNQIHYTIPNLITPNNDFKNDVFKIDSNSPVQGNLEIYNSWGANIYQNISYKNTWPEHDIEAGVYYYRFIYSTCAPEKGWLQVIK